MFSEAAPVLSCASVRVSGGDSGWNLWSQGSSTEIIVAEREEVGSDEWDLCVGCSSSGVLDKCRWQNCLTLSSFPGPLGRRELQSALSAEVAFGCCLPQELCCRERSNWCCCTRAGCKYLFRVNLNLGMDSLH